MVTLGFLALVPLALVWPVEFAWPVCEEFPMVCGQGRCEGASLAEAKCTGPQGGFPALEARIPDGCPSNLRSCGRLGPVFAPSWPMSRVDSR